MQVNVYSHHRALMAGVSFAVLMLAVHPAMAEDKTASDDAVQVPAVSVTDTATPTNKTPSATTEGTKSYATPAVTVTGKQPVEWKDVPNSVAVITRQEMDDRNMTTLSDALQQATGVTVVPNDGTQSQYLSRGYAMAVMFDGIPNYTGTGASGFQQFDMSIYDRVEVLKGPSGLLQGSDSPGGTVNLVRKQAKDSFGYSGALSEGSWNNTRMEQDVTGPLNADGSLRGRISLTEQNHDYFYDNASDVKRVGYATLAYDVTPNTTATVSETYQHDRASPYMGVPNYTNGTFLDVSRSFNPMAPWSKYIWDTQEQNAQIEHKFGGDWVGKVASTWRQQYFRFNDGFVNSGVNPSTNTVGYTERDKRYWYTWSNQDAYVTGPFHLLGQTHSLLLGANSSQYNYDYAGSGNVSAVASTPLFNPSGVVTNQPTLGYTAGGKSTTEQYGAYSQLRLKLLDPLTVVSGARISDFSNRTKGAHPATATNWSQGAKVTNEITPYYGLIYDVTKQVAVYGSYADIFIPQTNLQANGQSLPARQGEQYEVGTKGSFLNGKLNTTVAVFRIEDTNRAYADAANPGYYLAAGKGLSEGWEAEITGSPMPDLELTAGYTFLIDQVTTASSGQGSQIDVWEPKHSLKLWGKYSFTEGDLKDFSLGAGVNAQTLIHGNGSQTPLQQPAYATISAQIGYQIREDLSATLSGNNIFDTKYYTRVQGPNTYNIYGDPRNFMLTLRKSM